MLKRLAAVLLAAPLALGTASPAQADTGVTVLPGCWGAVYTFCDVAVSVPVDQSSFGVPVCAGTCTWVYVPWVYTTGNQTCVTYKDAYGWWTYSTCV